MMQLVPMHALDLIKTQHRNFEEPVRFAYIAGIEGSGHHGAILFAEQIAIACNYTFYARQKQVREVVWTWSAALTLEQKVANLTETFDLYRAESHRGRVVVSEDMSFPVGSRSKHRVFLNQEEIKNIPLYDIDGIHGALVGAGADVKILYLHRDFAQTVSSHPGLDHGFQAHATVLAAYKRTILEAYESFRSMGNARSWRLINYDWFDADDLLPDLVSEWAHFLGYTQCDIAKAVQGIQSIRHSHSKHAVTAEDQEFLKKLLSKPFPPEPVPLIIPPSEQSAMLNPSYTPVNDSSSSLQQLFSGRLVVGFGDSLTRGTWRSEHGKTWHPYTIKLSELLEPFSASVFNLGIAGEKVSSMVNRLGAELEQEQKTPIIVIILAGTNDIGNWDGSMGVKAETIASNITALHDIVQHHAGNRGSKIYTIAVAIPQLRLRREDESRRADKESVRMKVNEQLREYAAAHSGTILYVDYIDTFDQNNHENDYLWSVDWLHLSGPGYDKLAELLYSSMIQFLSSVSAS